MFKDRKIIGLILIKLLFAFNLVLAEVSYSEECIENRAVIDIGSGETKLIVAKIDLCKEKVLKKIYKQEIAVKYASDLKKSKSKKLSQAIIKQGLKALEDLINKAQELKSKQIVVIATAAIREASNSKSYLDSVFERFNLKVVILKAKEEASLGFRAVSRALNIDATEKIAVWDLGSGSTQITTFNSNDRIASFFTNNFASTSMLNYVRSTFKRKTDTINPLGLKNVKKAVDYAYEKIKAMQKENAQLIKNLKTRKVYGISWHYYICYQFEGKEPGCSFSKQELETSLYRRAAFTNKQIGAGKYSGETITTMMLILAYMNAFNINNVHTLDVNIGDEIFFYSKLWEK